VWVKSSVINNRNVGIKCFNSLTFLLLPLVFAYIHISQGSVETHLQWGGMYNNWLLQIVRKVCQSKNFENRSLIGEDIDKSKVPRFTAHGVVPHYTLI